MARKKTLMKYSELVKSLQFAYENATGDELDEEYAKEMGEFLIDDLGLASSVEMDEIVEEEVYREEDEEDA